MILPDANLLIYAVNSSAAQHPAARAWFETALSSGEEVGFPWVVLLAFLRITTHHKILPQPLPSRDAIFFIDSWLDLPQCSILNPGKGHWTIFRKLLENTNTVAGNITTDAHIAALALENGATLYSADYDFQRFPGLEHVNPLQKRY